MKNSGSFVNGVVCPVKMGSKNRGSFDLQPYQISLSIFHWAQAAPTRYRDSSHCKKLSCR